MSNHSGGITPSLCSRGVLAGDEEGRFVRTGANWTLATIVSRGARLWPTSDALVDGVRHITFQELERKTRLAAALLSQQGVNAGDRVAILGDRCADTVIALLAVAAIGAAYVALDPDQPRERIVRLLDDANVRLIVAHVGAREKLGELEGSPALMAMEWLADLPGNVSDLPEPDAFTDFAASSVAYMLYTSGSTGMSKGVQITHSSIQVFFEAHNERIQIRPGDRCLSTGPFYFDVSVMDVLLPLNYGATVYFAPKTLIPSLVLRMLSTNAITHFYAVGTLLGLITGSGERLDRYELDALRVLQTGAEVCNVRVVNEWLRRYPELRFLNSYGPTEATVGCLSYLKPYVGPLKGNSCPIGKPHRGTSAIVVAPDGRVIQEAGVIGELLVAGPQVMQGYWNRPLENERSLVELLGRLYYRTGDYVFFDGEGDYYFVGRRDEEIKLSGFRIHLNEVRNCVQQDSRVVTAIVGIVSTRAAPIEIAAVVTTAQTFASDQATDVAANVARQLPTYMVPTRWAVMASLPRLPSGKVDRKAVLSSFESAIARADARYYVESKQGLVPMGNA